MPLFLQIFGQPYKTTRCLKNIDNFKRKRSSYEFPALPAHTTFMLPCFPQHVNSSRILLSAMIHSLLWMMAVNHHFESWLITTCLTIISVLDSYQMAARESTFFSVFLLMSYYPGEKKKVFEPYHLFAFYFYFISNMSLTQNKQNGALYFLTMIHFLGD